MSREGTEFRSCNFCKNELPRVISRKNGFHLVQCPSCGLVYVGNPPPKEELEKLYSFDSGYKKRFRDDTAEFKHEFTLASKNYEFIKKHKTRGRILDIGCADGSFLRVAKNNGWETYGMEISRDLVEVARKRYGLKILSGTLNETSFMTKSFDVVTMWDLIEHVEDPMQTMSIVNRILKDDGIVGISTPNIDGLFPKLSYKISNIVGYWPHPEPPYHLFQFSKKTIYELLELTGFSVLEMHDKRTSISYSFGRIRSLIRSPKRLLYSAIFIPTAILGPIVHSGDWITVVAKKARACKAIHEKSQNDFVTQ